MTTKSMSDVAYDIEQLYIEGYRPLSISAQLNIPVDMVYDWIEDNGCGTDFDPPEIEAYDMDEVYSPFSTANS